MPIYYGIVIMRQLQQDGRGNPLLIIIVHGNRNIQVVIPNQVGLRRKFGLVQVQHSQPVP